MSYLGDIALGKTFDTKFTTVSTTGAPTVLAGSPVISAYVDNSTTQLTAGITLSVDFDGVVGLNNIRVVATSGNGYAAGGNYQLVITTGTVGGTSVAGYVVAEFSIEARSSLRPTVADRTLDVSAGGEAGLDWANIGSPTTAQNLSGTNIDVDQVVASVSGAVGSVTAGVNVTQLGGVAQSLTDLKDFADDGYDPATNKVQGVVLTDTLTTYTGNTPQTGDSFARLGAPAGASVSADILAVDNLVDDLESRLGTPSNLGSGATVAANLVDIEGQTDDIGIAGVGLTAIPWNAAWDAEVQSEVDDALVAQNLDHLVKIAVDTDFATTVHLNSVVGHLADNGAAATFDRTTDSLEALQGTSAPSAATIADAVWDEILAGHLGVGSTGEALNAAGAAGDPWSTALPGAYGAGSAGNIIGNNVNATISSRATPAQVNTEVDTALADARLDELLAADSDIDGAAPPTVGSVFHELLTKTAGSFTYDQTTDSLEALRDRGDAAWTTATGFSTLTQADIRTAVGLAAANLDTQLAAISAFIDTEITTILSRLGSFTGSGVNTVLGFFQALMRSDSTTPSDLGGTYDDATDSLQAIRDRGDSAWTTGTTPPTVGAIADAVWDETLADHLAVGSTGAGLNAASSAGDPWTTALPGAYGVGTAGKIVGDNVNATISSRSTHTAADIWAVATRLLTAGTNIVLAKGVGVTGFNDLSAAQVNTEVVDALNVDTYPEASTAPAATTTLAAKIVWLSTLARNKITQTSTVQTLRNDADNGNVATASVSDDATTAIRGRWT